MQNYAVYWSEGGAASQYSVLYWPENVIDWPGKGRPTCVMRYACGHKLQRFRLKISFWSHRYSVPRAHAPLYPRGILETRLRKPGICSRVHFSRTNFVHGRHVLYLGTVHYLYPRVGWEIFMSYAQIL